MDSLNEVRRLRAAADNSRSLQRLAGGGFCVAALGVTYANDAAFKGTWLGTLLLLGAPVFFCASFVPFFSAKCPSCRQRFNSVANLFRSSDAAACASCGFNLGKHIPRYGSGCTSG